MKISANWIRDLVSGQSRRTEKLRIPKVTFVREQDGTPERALKSALMPSLKAIGAAGCYLAVVRYNDESTQHVALCLSGLNASRSVVEEISGIFKTSFKEDEHLDILFLSEIQKEQIERVCTAFYSRELEQ